MNLLSFSIPSENIFSSNYAEASVNDCTDIHYYCPLCLSSWAIRSTGGGRPAAHIIVKVIYCREHGDGKLFSNLKGLPPLNAFPTIALQRELSLWESIND